MRREVKELLERADNLSQKVERDLSEVKRVLFEIWESILADEGLGLIG